MVSFLFPCSILRIIPTTYAISPHQAAMLDVPLATTVTCPSAFQVIAWRKDYLPAGFSAACGIDQAEPVSGSYQPRNGLRQTGGVPPGGRNINDDELSAVRGPCAVHAQGPLQCTPGRSFGV
jgi:hypothetical protein